MELRDEMEGRIEELGKSGKTKVGRGEKVMRARGR